MTYKLGSLFDGSGGFPLAGSLCGIEPVWASEVEPYPVAVTRSRFPRMKHLGDISKINGAEVEPVDIICAGSPCQDLSVAGLRKGLKHEANGDEETTRSGLFMEFVRIIKEMRKATNGKYPTFALWENVPGAFSSNKGEDFRIVLEELIKVVEPKAVMPAVPKNGWSYADSYCGDGWSLAYRVFDAQYWGVPQRRRRIHLVLDLRGERAREVLFERQGLRGYFAESGTPWQAAPCDAENGIGADDCERSGIAYTLKIRSGCEGGGKGALVQEDKSATLATNNDQYLFQPVGLDFYNMAVTGDVSKTLNAVASDADHVPCVMKPVTLEPGIAQREGGHIYEGVSGTLRANMGDNQMSVAYSDVVLDDQGGQQIGVRTDGKSPTLRAEMHGNVPCVMESAGFNYLQGSKARSIGFETEKAGTLRAGQFGDAVIYSVENHPADSRVNIDESGKVQTLTSRMGTGGGNVPMIMEPIDGTRATIGLSGGTVSPTLISRMETATGTTQDNLIVCEPMLASGNDVSGCLMASGYEKLGAQEMFGGDYTVVEQKPVYCLQGGGATSQNSQGMGYKADTSYTLNTTDVHGVAYKEQPAICCTTGSFMQVTDEVSPTLMARDYKDPNVVAYAKIHPTHEEIHEFIADNNADAPHQQDLLQAPEGVARTIACGTHASGSHLTKTIINLGTNYIVRRLTPTECARLQGFADRWGDIDPKEDFTDEEYKFWLEVRNTHATVIGGKEAKEYTKAQMLSWYNKLHTDSAEYKMWGNGIALPPALYVVQGMAEVLNAEIPTGVAEERAEAEEIEVETAKPTDDCKTVTIKRVSNPRGTIDAYNRLRNNRHNLTKQQKQTIRGQIKSGDVAGAMRGMDRLLDYDSKENDN